MNSNRETPQEHTIRVVASSDQGYARHLGVMFASVLANAAQPHRYRLFVIDGGIEPATRRAITAEVSRRGATVEFLQLDRELYSNMPLRRKMTAAAYYRISIPELFDSSVSRVIYLDCDLIVKADLAELWHTPLNGRHLGAVENISNSTYRASGLAQEQYFNSGVMLIDLDLWRRDDIPGQVREFKLRYPHKIVTNDQCALNGVLHDKWQRLPLRWNQQSGLYRATKQLRHFPPEEVEAALWAPAIIHYVGAAKPWKYLCFHPLAGEYRRYLDQTVWAGTGPEGKNLAAAIKRCLSPRLVKKRLRQQRWQRRYDERGIFA